MSRSLALIAFVACFGLSEAHVMSPAISPVVPGTANGSEKRPLSRTLKGKGEEKEDKKKDDVKEESDLGSAKKKDKVKKGDTIGCALDKSNEREEMKVNFMYKVEGVASTIADLDDEIEDYEDMTSKILQEEGLIDCAIFDTSGESTSSLVTGPGTRRGLRRLDPKINVVAIDTKPKDKISEKECTTNFDSTDCEYVEGSLKLILQEDPNIDDDGNKTEQQKQLYDETIGIIRREMALGAFNGQNLVVTYESADSYNGTNVTVVFAEKLRDEAGDFNETGKSSAAFVRLSTMISAISGLSLAFAML